MAKKTVQGKTHLTLEEFEYQYRNNLLSPELKSQIETGKAAAGESLLSEYVPLFHDVLVAQRAYCLVTHVEESRVSFQRVQTELDKGGALTARQLFFLICAARGIDTAKMLTEMARKAANIRHSQPGGSRERKAEILKLWASGLYISREICAEEEWRDLGYGSPKTARNALRNTLKPNPWIAKEIQKQKK